MKNKGIVLFIILAVSAALFVFMFSGKEETPARKKAVTGLPAPDFALNDLSGKSWRLADLRGKVVLVNFWATWCDSCKEENPSLKRFMDSERENKNIVLVAVLYNDTPKNAVEYLRKNNLDFNVLLDDRKASADYGITGVPETFIISKDGTLKGKFIGPVRWDDLKIKAAIEKLAAEI
jgi:cytochrome c biogenesis protein CcmG/thiol:disulfide interchange protein DsbE